MKHMGIERWLAYSVRRKELDQDLEESSTYMRGRVLEIGGGRTGRRGRFTPPMQQCSEWIHLDIISTPQPHIVADVQRLPHPNNCFDTVVCLEVLEYVDCISQGIAEMVRILKPAGHLILAVPFLHRADNLHDYWRLTEHGLSKLLDKNGLNSVKTVPQGGALAVATSILKYSISSDKSTRRRILLGYLARPFLSLMWRLDAPTMKRNELLATFSTGYLSISRKAS